MAAVNNSLPTFSGHREDHFLTFETKSRAHKESIKIGLKCATIFVGEPFWTLFNLFQQFVTHLGPHFRRRWKLPPRLLFVFSYIVLLKQDR